MFANTRSAHKGQLYPVTETNNLVQRVEHNAEKEKSMSRKKANVEVLPAFTDREKNEYVKLTEKITTTQMKADGLARTIAGALYTIRQKKLYMIDGYKNVYEYAGEKHGISRGTCNDAIKVFERFSNPDTKQIDEEWAGFAWRALIMIKGLTDDEIKEMGITPETSSTAIKKMLDERKAIEDGSKTDNVSEEQEDKQEENAPSDEVEVSESEREEPNSFPQHELHLSDLNGIEELTQFFLENWDAILNSDYDVLVTK